MWQGYDRHRIEQYIGGSNQMIDENTYREGFKEGIQCALNELDMMVVEDKIHDPACNHWDYKECNCKVLPPKTMAEKGWEYAQKLSDEAKENKVEEELFGKLTGDEFKFNFKAWKGNWDGSLEEEPTELHVSKAAGWRLHEWNGDEDGGPGIVLYGVFETPNGKGYTAQFIIPKDELIKALALLVEG